MATKAITIKQVDTWVTSLQGSYKSLPNLPKGVSEFIVQITPWASLILGLISLIAWGLLALLSVLTSPFLALAGPGFLVRTLAVAIVALIQGVFMLMAFPATKAGSMTGWRLLTYVAILGLISSILSLSVSNIIGGLIGAAIEFYFLFQIKSYYK
jgi:hypothetical protein